MDYMRMEQPGVSASFQLSERAETVGGGREICSWHKSPEKPGSKTFGVSSSTPEFACGSAAATAYIPIGSCSIYGGCAPSFSERRSEPQDAPRACVPIKPPCEDSLPGNPRMTAFTAGPRTATRGDSFCSPRRVTTRNRDGLKHSSALSSSSCSAPPEHRTSR